jgi:N-acyl-D-aspartate/D-glutamate deacylase
MDFDLVIRNGVVIDGSGASRVEASVGVVGDRITVVGEVDGKGREEIDAQGCVVAPGFVDAHTHMDAQVFWNELGASSCWHGVTTAVMGNCGYTLAPVHAGDQPLVVKNIERAEDIPGEAIAAGVPWGWSTFSELLDVIDSLPKGINYGQAVGHSALRIWAMGADAFERTSTADELAVMERELADGLRAGAVGFTTSTNHTHTASDNRPVASRLASWDELLALVNVVGRHGAGSFEVGGVPDGSTHREHLARLADLALSTGVPTLVSTLDLTPVRVIEDVIAKGGQMWGLTHCRPPISNLQSFRTHLSFDFLGGLWGDVRSRPLEEQRKLLTDPDIRARLVEAARHGDYRPIAAADAFEPDYDLYWIMYSTYLPNPTVAEEAKRRGVDPVEVIIDVALEHDFDIFFLQGYYAPPSDEVLIETIRCPHSTMTFSDSGAHVSTIVDASIQTHLLAYWVRERGALSLEEAIPLITSNAARAWGLHDRGRLAPGYAADITIFDPDAVAPLMPEVLRDLPGGAPRLDQRSTGYHAVIVNGEIFIRNGEATDTRAGRLLRNGQMRVH